MSAESPLSFAFLKQLENADKVTTGHANGLITLNIDEADEIHRTKTRLELGENYRTLLGHFRHESGHYFWEKMVLTDKNWLKRFREQFGDEKIDYAQALKAHYDTGAPSNWRDFFVSTYASAHPWEDWAETWSHYLHMVDALETARGYGMALNAAHPDSKKTKPQAVTWSISTKFDELVSTWITLSLALNSFNRGMGQSDLYPFTLSSAVKDKLRYIHELIQEKCADSV